MTFKGTPDLLFSQTRPSGSYKLDIPQQYGVYFEYDTQGIDISNVDKVYAQIGVTGTAPNYNNQKVELYWTLINKSNDPNDHTSAQITLPDVIVDVWDPKDKTITETTLSKSGQFSQNFFPVDGQKHRLYMSFDNQKMTTQVLLDDNPRGLEFSWSDWSYMTINGKEVISINPNYQEIFVALSIGSPLQNVWLGTDVGIATIQGNISAGSRRLMTNFCSSSGDPTNSMCDCLTASQKPEWQQIEANTPIPGQCFIPPCTRIEPPVYVPPVSGSQTCKDNLTLCEIVFSANENSNNNLKDNHIYQNCCQNDPNCSNPPSPGSNDLWWILGIGGFLLLLIILGVALVVHDRRHKK